MRAPTSVGVPSAGVLGGKLRELPDLDHIDVLLNGSLQCPVDPDSLGIQLHECSHSDASHNDPVHTIASQSQEGLAHAVGVVLVGVGELCLDPQSKRRP